MKRILIVLAGLAVTSVAAVEGPSLMNYQGVLRDSGGNPLSGDHDMVFRFFDAETGGDEMLIDAHTLTGGGPVTVTGGLFNVALGGGQVADGSGPGNFTTLTEVFSNRTEMWLQIQVGAETLDPRVRILASAYAMNSTKLDGNSSSDFLRSNVDDTAGGAITFAAEPTGTAATDGSVVINPPSAGSTSTLLGIAVNGTEKLSVNGDGFLTALGGGYFQDPNSFAYIADGPYGVVAYGDTAGGYFRDNDSSALTIAGDGEYGVSGFGNTAGGRFEDWNGSGVGYAGIGNYGFQGKGTEAGGFFWDDDSTGYGYVGYGDLGIRAFGSTAGGFFGNLGGSGSGYVGHGDRGISASGNTAGGHFEDLNESGLAWVGIGDDGVRGYGNLRGGYFKNLIDSGWAEVGIGDYGIKGYGEAAGGYFIDSNGSGYAMVGKDDIGIQSYGDFAGGYFYDRTSGTYLYTAYNTSSTIGAGAKNFIQNHPDDPDQVVVYSAIEGDEVGTYTRGSARLDNGEARIELGQTFQWVTNPDIGLTAHLTPRGASAGLYVESLSTTSLVVRGSSESDVAFDYVVFGLRIGFEDVSVVREKEMEAYIPSMVADQEMLSRNPSLESFTALERFKRMESDVSGIDLDAIDFSRSRQLAAAIVTYDPEIHRPELPGRHDETEPVAPVDEAVTGSVTTSSLVRSDPVAPTAAAVASGQSHPADLTHLVPVSEAVEAGDVLAIDLEQPGSMRRAADLADPGIVGIVSGEADSGNAAEAPVALAGMILCNVDAGYGEIRPGDLLTSSPTAGHAMRAHDAIPGTILAKALEPLETGTGQIRVLLMLR